jgi:SPP1 gp7 family putative phage head morphogenesis protein
MKNSDYWKDRFSQLEDAQHKMGVDSLADIEKQYKQAQKELESKISVWYQRFADNNNITLAEARQWITGKDLKEFKWDVADYIDYGKDNAVDGIWMKQLENASAKFHISKLEALKMQTQQSLETMFAKQQGTVQGTMADVLQTGYYKTAYELQKGFNIGFDIASLDQPQIEKLLSKPWAADAYNFSERIWKNKNKLISEVHNELTRNVMLGQDPQNAIDAIAKKMQTSKYNAGRLVMTEEAYFSSLSQKECFQSLNVEQYEIVATLDSHTSEICQGLDGQVFPMSGFEAGVTAPPFHPYCRSTTVPYFDDNFGQLGERAAKDENGKTYYVPDDITYPEWKQTFVDGNNIYAYDAYTENGTDHYKKHVEPEPEKPKKEYLTKKKLEANIANADVQLEDLENQFKEQSGGWTYEEAVKDFGSLNDFADGDELIKMQELKNQMDAVQAQKAEWQEKLDKKIIVEKQKQLTKQQIDLQQQLDEFEVKTYSGIWKDDVTTADWSKLNIEGKKKYYEGKFITETDPELMQKYSDLYKQLQELDTEGKAYYDVQSELNKIQTELTNLKNGSKIKSDTNAIFPPEAYTQERKDAAYWFKSKEKADNLLRPYAEKVWADTSSVEHRAAYDYTCGSGGFNRPLRGYEDSWYNFKGVGNVSLNQEGKEEAIKELTSMIDKSTYDFDIWVQRGIETDAGAASFLGIDENVLLRATQEELESILVNQEIKDEAFVSCGTAKGSGFNGYIFNVYCPKGTKMLYAEPFSHYGGYIDYGKWDGAKKQSYFHNEFETIIQRGTKFRITKVEKAYGNVYIDIEVVEQEKEVIL